MEAGVPTVDAQVPVFFLHVLADVDLLCLVLEPELLERDADLLPVRRAGRVEDDILWAENCQRHGLCWSATMDMVFRPTVLGTLAILSERCLAWYVVWIVAVRSVILLVTELES